MPSVNDIRSSFLNYFGQNDHEIVASSSLIPSNDPTLLFTNAGMVQFKNVFTGGETRKIPRAATSQKCVRAGGKHNDLENVGHTARHHTFFEMLGNFSFGDYFKEQAIHQAWDLIVGTYGLPPEKMLVTIYHDDEEAASWWKKIAGLGDDRIIRIATSDNFWSMGDTGPCGPCSEIFFDHGAHIAGGPPGSPDEDGDRFIEIWNLVFMQYEQLAPNKRIDLPRPSIDTGMGLERISAVMQGKHDNYDIDLMQHIISASADITGVSRDSVSHRVIADHLRASAFLIADGVLPSNDGRGYVLRRIMRRAMRHAHQMGCIEPMMHALVPVLVTEMGGHFTELQRSERLIAETLKTEELRFKETLGRGLKILADELAHLGKGGVLGGAMAFKLYDTYGFPLDLTQDVMRGFDCSVDLAGFNKAMEGQKAMARKAWSGSGDAAVDRVFIEAASKYGATEFLGYETNKAEANILSIISKSEEVGEAKSGEVVSIICNQTPFYGESGGQQGDTGQMIDTDSGAVLGDVTNTWKINGVFIHEVALKSAIKQGDAAALVIDDERRKNLRSNHSATHLMHEALREVLGDHVMQKGSLVAPSRLRFDFSHSGQVTASEIAAVEAIVNDRILMNSEVTTRIMTPDAAIAEGALALFGEKYGDEVRVVSMGGDTGVEGRSAWSVELCGGTHVERTGDIGLFKITAESGVAGGIRRIEAVTGTAVSDWFSGQISDLEEKNAGLTTKNRELNQQISGLRQKLAEGSSSDDIMAINGIGFSRRILDDVPAREVKTIAENLLKKDGADIAAVISKLEGKASLVVATSGKNLDAVELVRIGSKILGGKGGGGRPDMAQAGGDKPENAEAALEAIADYLRNLKN